VNPLTIILILASIKLAVGLVAVVAWLVSTTWLNRVERRLAHRKGVYRTLVASLATRERELLDPEIHRMGTLLDLEALEAVLEEQARGTAERPAWLLDVYDRLGLMDKYIERLRTARKWRERAFAAELLGRVGNARAVPALLETAQATRTEDSDVREIALRALARIGDPRAVEPLIEALKTAEAWLAPRIADILTRHGELVIDPLLGLLEHPGRHPARAWAANVLGEVRARRAFGVLARGLDDVEDEVRAKSATALGRLGDRRAVAYLLEHLLSDPAPFVRARIASALGQFEEPEVVDRLVRGLGDPAWWVRMRSVEALEQIGGRAEGPLLVALDDPDPEIRVRAAVALERQGVAASLVALIQRGERVPEAMDTLVKFVTAGARELLAELLIHHSPDVRAAAVTAVRRASRLDLAPELIHTAGADTEPGIRALALDTLGTLALPAAVSAAIRGLSDSDGRVRAAAVGVFGELGGGEAIERLRHLTGDPDPSVRMAAARALGTLKATAAAPDLERLLGDSEPGVRVAAAQAIGFLGEPSVLPALSRGFGDASPELRVALVQSAGRLQPASISTLLDTIVESGDIEAKLGILRSVSRGSSPAGPEIVSRLWQDPDPGVRAAALEAFARLGGDQAIGPVNSGLRDPDERVRATAVDACARLHLEDQGSVILTLLQADPSPRVRERAALAVGLLRVPSGDTALLMACHRQEPLEVRAAAALAAGAFDHESIVERVVEMPDEEKVRAHIRERLRDDPEFRALGQRLSLAGHLELRALGAVTDDEIRLRLTEGMRSILDAEERIRLIGGLRAFQGEGSRGALLQVVRGDPSPEVRTAALSAVAELLDPDQLLEVARRALGDPSLLVRRAAVGLFSRIPPDRGFPDLLHTLRADDDPAVLASVAELAESSFPTFLDLVLAQPPDGPEPILVARVARYIHHPELTRLLPVMAHGPPELREAIADLWGHRPDVVDPTSLEALVLDPVVPVRQAAARAAAAAERWDLLERMLEDPDAGVRREIAVVLGHSTRLPRRAWATLEQLGADADMEVRAAAYVGRLLQGNPMPMPPDLDAGLAGEAVRSIADLPALRHAARTAPDEERRLASALTLALVSDEVAGEVARTDPVPAIRHQVGGALELATRSRERRRT
jgi:HEAT repeat protein